MYNRTTLKNILANAALHACRAYVRHFPAVIGKRLLWDKVIDPYLAWRAYKGVATTEDGSKFEIDLPDQLQTKLFFFGEWEPYITRLVRERLAPGDVFIDVGANVGYYALLAAKIVGASGRVHAVEASPIIFERLRRNVSINNAENVVLHNCAASHRQQELSLFSAPRENIGATTTIQRDGFAFEARVPADTLPSIVGDDLLKAALVKIDVEGAEASVIRGLLSLLPSMSADWVIEVRPSKTDGEFILRSFREAGYQAYRIDNDYTVDSYIRPRSGQRLAKVTGAITAMQDIVFSKNSLTRCK